MSAPVPIQDSTDEGAEPELVESTKNPMTRRTFARNALLAAGGAMVANVATIPVGAQAIRTPKSKSRDNKAIVGRWFTEFWGNPWNPKIVDELGAPDILLQYSLHAARRGREDVRAFMTGFREAFPDLSFAGAADLITEGDYVVGRWVGGGTHTGPAFSDFLAGSLPAASGRKMRFTGTTVLRVENGKIAEEVGLDDGVTALMQLGLIQAS